MYLEVFSKMSKSGRMLIALLDLMFKKGILNKEELHLVCHVAEDPIKFNEVFNCLVHAAVPNGEAIILGTNLGCPLYGAERAACPFCSHPPTEGAPRPSLDDEGGPL